MAIRVYFCKWSRVGNNITNPIRDILTADAVIPGIEWASYYYGTANPNTGEPTKDMCFVFVKGTDFSAIDAIPNIWEFPEGNLDNKLNKPQRNTIMNYIGPEFGLPSTFLDDCVTRRDAIEKFAREIEPAFSSFGSHITAAEFI